MDILFDCRCSCNCSVRLRWVSVIYMAGSQNAFTMCGCVYPYSKHRDVDNNWHGADPMWITFFHIWIRELFFEKRALALFFLCTKMCQIKKSLKIMSEFKTPNPVYMEGKEKFLWFEKNPNMKEVHCSSDCTLKTKGADTSWLTGLPDRFMTGSCRRRLRIGYGRAKLIMRPPERCRTSAETGDCDCSYSSRVIWNDDNQMYMYRQAKMRILYFLYCRRNPA